MKSGNTINLFTLDEANSGTLFELCVDKDEIQAYIDLGTHGPRGSKAMVLIRGREKPAYVAESFEKLGELLS